MPKYTVNNKGAYYLDKMADGIQRSTIAHEEGITEQGVYLSVYALIRNSKLKIKGMKMQTDTINKLEKDLFNASNLVSSLTAERNDLRREVENLKVLTKDAKPSDIQFARLSDNNKKLMEANNELRKELAKKEILQPIEKPPITFASNQDRLIDRLLSIIEKAVE